VTRARGAERHDHARPLRPELSSRFGGC
jgi:hypothetical protein